MKTALTQLIEKWENERGSYIPNAPIYAAFIAEAKEFLESEKEQIMEAYNFGYRDGFHDAQSCVSEEKDVSEFANAKQYYTQTFK